MPRRVEIELSDRLALMIDQIKMLHGARLVAAGITQEPTDQTCIASCIWRMAELYGLLNDEDKVGPDAKAVN